MYKFISIKNHFIYLFTNDKYIKHETDTKMRLIDEEYSEYVDITEEKAKDIIYDILYDGVLAGAINPGEYMVIDDEGILIGDEEDFDTDVLYYAIPIDDVVDFSNVSVNSDFIDLDNVDIERIFKNI